MSLDNNQTKTITDSKKSVNSAWIVLLYNDPVNFSEYVTMILQKVLGYNVSRAHDLMLQVHNNGKAIIWSGSREKAEFYVQQLHTHQLNGTLEKV